MLFLQFWQSVTETTSTTPLHFAFFMKIRLISTQFHRLGFNENEVLWHMNCRTFNIYLEAF